MLVEHALAAGQAELGAKTAIEAAKRAIELHAPDEVLRLHYRWLNYDEKPLAEIPAAGLSADYVYRETLRAKEDVAKIEALKSAAKQADPKRPMELRYRYDREGLEKTDAYDDREISDGAKRPGTSQ